MDKNCICDRCCKRRQGESAEDYMWRVIVARQGKGAAKPKPKANRIHT